VSRSQSGNRKKRKKIKIAKQNYATLYLTLICTYKDMKIDTNMTDKDSLSVRFVSILKETSEKYKWKNLKSKKNGPT